MKDEKCEYPPYTGNLVPYDYADYLDGKDNMWYCSSLVRMAFLTIGDHAVDLNNNKKGAIAPSEIAASKYTKKVAGWTN